MDVTFGEFNAFIIIFGVGLHNFLNSFACWSHVAAYQYEIWLSTQLDSVAICMMTMWH